MSREPAAVVPCDEWLEAAARAGARAGRYLLVYGMTAAPLLELAARLLAKHRLDAVLIGNAAAALQGSPVTTVALDFMFRKTPANLRKLRRIADDLDAVVLHPFYPVSELYRVMRQRDGLQFDFMGKSMESGLSSR